MNETVRKMIELLFQNTEMNQEAQALHDELMANCQERFSDLVAQGHTADDAIGCVMDSLKGMEDVISQYPRKQAQVKVKLGIDIDDDNEDGSAQASKSYEFAAAEVEEVYYDSRSIDLVCDASSDNLVHVDCGEVKNVDVSLENGKLRIVKNKIETRSFNFNNLNLSNLIGFGKLFASEFGGDGEIRVSLPADKAFGMELHSTSGDFSVQGVALTQISADTTSGDIQLVPSISMKLSNAKLNTASGDVIMELAATQINAKTMSGEIKAHCECDSLNIVSVSGDVKFKGHANEINAKSVSGDVKLRNLGNELTNVSATSTSGNVRVKLPADIGAVELHAKSLSGNVRNAFKDCAGAVSVVVRASTVSGNVEVLADNG
ncbi:MAG: DUF4097 family beta strand repeat-containing protein [Eubacteriales bacterium]|nr:DUF4097 family beta strand repeat-containing protein [Eubacteriales bacterium]MDD3882466.1 DUF4097 family beta strand repeat-containing protein [Eubacteriales bacterium]MDD4513188.1 DUF4097 family beta strand repeat-containing protein [Eubacteriales bacterium]